MHEGATSKMSRLTTSPELPSYALVHCPTMDKQVFSNEWLIFSGSSNIGVSWWHCPVCGGWHVLPTALKNEIEKQRII